MCYYMCSFNDINFIILFPRIQESYSYRDPITEFVECLYVNFDFDMAQQKLLECEKVCILHSHNLTYSTVPEVLANFVLLVVCLRSWTMISSW